jgi:hypothetical protein
MQRAAWTDERLDDMSGRVDRDIRGLRADMNRGFAEVRTEFKAVRGEMSDEFKALRGEVAGEFGAVRSEIAELRTLIWRLNGGIFVAVVASFLLRGV